MYLMKNHKGRVQKKKSKNVMEFSIIGLTPPPPTPMMENFSVKSQSGGPPPKVKKILMHFCII